MNNNQIPFQPLTLGQLLLLYVLGKIKKFENSIHMLPYHSSGAFSVSLTVPEILTV